MLRFSVLSNVNAYNLRFCYLKFSLPDISMWKFKTKNSPGDVMNLENFSPLGGDKHFPSLFKANKCYKCEKHIGIL